MGDLFKALTDGKDGLLYRTQFMSMHRKLVSGEVTPPENPIWSKLSEMSDEKAWAICGNYLYDRKILQKRKQRATVEAIDELDSFEIKRSSVSLGRSSLK